MYNKSDYNTLDLCHRYYYLIILCSTKKDDQRQYANALLVDSAFILIHTLDCIHKY
jgi:hypothetical protein